MPETHFQIGDRVEVLDPIHELPYVSGEVDGITLDGDYEITPDGGASCELTVSEELLVEAAPSDTEGGQG